MKRTLLMDIKVGQSLSIDGGRIVITLEEKSGQRAKLRFVHEGVPIERVSPDAPAQTERKQAPRASGAQQAMLGTKVTA